MMSFIFMIRFRELSGRSDEGDFRWNILPWLVDSGIWGYLHKLEIVVAGPIPPMSHYILTAYL